MNRNGIYIRVLLVVMALAVLVSFLGRNSHRAPRDTWLPSTFNPVGAGTMAFYETLEGLHWPLARWREPLGRLDAQGTGNALLITRSRVNWRAAYSEQESALLENWVRKGNTLFLFGPMGKWDDTRLLLEQLGFQLEKERADASFFPALTLAQDKPVEAAPGAGETGRLVLPEGATLPTTQPQNARQLWTTAAGPAAVDLLVGSGHVIVVASAEVLSNRYLDQGDNLAIVLRLLAPDGRTPRHLFFEEAHHGFTATFALARLGGHPGVRLAILLALLGLATFLGSIFVRFGPILPLQREPGRSSLEFVDSIAALYHRSDVRNETIRFLFEETHRQLLHRLNLPPGAPHELIAARVRQSHPDLPGWKKLAQRFDSQDYVAGLPPGGWLRVARELIQIKAAFP